MVKQNSKHYKFVDEDKLLRYIEDEIRMCSTEQYGVLIEWSFGYKAALVSLRQRIKDGSINWQPGSE